MPSLTPRPLNAIGPDNGAIKDTLKRSEMCFDDAGQEACQRTRCHYPGVCLLAPRILDLFAHLGAANPIAEDH
jgi:hypothetical protein